MKKIFYFDRVYLWLLLIIIYQISCKTLLDRGTEVVLEKPPPEVLALESNHLPQPPAKELGSKREEAPATRGTAGQIRPRQSAPKSPNYESEKPLNLNDKIPPETKPSNERNQKTSINKPSKPRYKVTAMGSFARADLIPMGASATNGSAAFIKTEDGIRLNINIGETPPGTYATLIADVQDCDAYGHTLKQSNQQAAVPSHQLGTIIVGTEGSGQMTIDYQNINELGGLDAILGKVFIVKPITDRQENLEGSVAFTCGVIAPISGAIQELE